MGSGTSSKALPVGAWSALRSDWSFTNMSVERSQCQLNKIGKPVKFCGLPVSASKPGVFSLPKPGHWPVKWRTIAADLPARKRCVSAMGAVTLALRRIDVVRG